MKFYPDFRTVKDELGDKILRALGGAGAGARADLARYRRQLPEWVASHSERGLAAWIHDRLWHHAVDQLQDVEHVAIIDKGMTREITVSGKFRIRLKRHGWQDRVSSYPTRTVLEFMHQPTGQLVLEGLEMVRLVAGYRWDAEAREIGESVISLRDGIENVVWTRRLPEPTADAPAQLPQRPEPPSRPVLELLFDDIDDISGGSRAAGNDRL